MQIRSTASRLVFFLGLCVATVALVVSSRRLEDRPHNPDLGAAPIYLPQARYLRPLSLGYDIALSDLLWFRTISYFGEHYRSDRVYPWLAYMCNLVTDLDPRADYVYRFGGMILPWEAHEADAGIALLEKGVRALPNSWMLHYWLGFSYYFFKADQGRALTHLERSAQLPGAHANAAALVASLRAQQYGPATALAFLAEIARDTDNEQMREVVHGQMQAAQLAVDIDLLTDAVATYRAQTGRFPESLPALVEAQLVSAIPAEPYGGTYQIDPETGAVRSSTGHQPLQLHRSKNAEAVLRGETLP